MCRATRKRKWFAAAAVAAFAMTGASAHAQETGGVEGTVTLVGGAGPVHGAVVLLVGTGRTALTAAEGDFEFESVPPGSYEVLAQREHLTAGRQAIVVVAGEVATVDFELAPSPVHEDVTVTASAGGAEPTFEAFNAVTTLDSFDIVQLGQGSLGDALQNEPGIASRSFGPGSSRPIIRGFDGDRVLILQDGVRTGDLSSQSGDHGVTIDPNGAANGSRSCGGRPRCSTAPTPSAASSTSSRPRRASTSRCSTAPARSSPPMAEARTARPASISACSMRRATSASGAAAACGGPATTTRRKARSPTRRPS